MKFVYIDSGVVREAVQSDPATLFVPMYAARFIDAPDHVEAGWLYDGHAFTAPAPDLTALRAAHWDAIKAERDKRIQTGGYQAAGKWFHGDTFSRTQQMGLVMMGAGIPANLQWKTMDGSFVSMTQTLAGQVFAAAAASDAAIFARAEQIRATMDADPAAFDLSAHAWPLVFGG